MRPSSRNDFFGSRPVRGGFSTGLWASYDITLEMYIAIFYNFCVLSNIGVSKFVIP